MNEQRIFQFDAVTGESSYRQLTADEVKEFEAMNQIRVERQENLIAQAAAKAALLERLGITEEEAKLLLG